MSYKIMIGSTTFQFADLKDLMAKASPRRSADLLAKLSALTQTERVAAQMCLADLPLSTFLNEEIIDSKIDEVSRLIQEQFDDEAFKLIASHTVGSFRDWLLSYTTRSAELKSV